VNAESAAAWTAIFVTLGIALVGWARANRAKIDADRALAAAERSAAAADRSAAAQERMADQWAESLSRAEKRDQRQWFQSSGQTLPWPPPKDGGPWNGPMPGAGPSEPVVHWTVDRIKGRQHLLKNLGRTPAYDVTLTAENTVRFDAPGPQTVREMGGTLEFLAIGSLQTGTPELVVRWRDTPDGEYREWRRPLP
jgi:hypothetical protein